MPTHKVHSNFATIGNDVVQSDTLSFKAKGLLAYLISKPEGWEFSSVRIAQEVKEGARLIQNALKELENDGLLVREKQLNGHVCYHVYSSYDLLKIPKRPNSRMLKAQNAKSADINNKDNTSKKEIIIINNNGELSPSKKLHKDCIDLLILSFKELTGFSPTDKKPRYEAYNLVRAIEAVYKEAKKEFVLEGFKKHIGHYFTWLSQQDWSSSIQTMSVVRRKYTIFYEQEVKHAINK